MMKAEWHDNLETARSILLVGHVIVEDRGVVKAREVAVDLIARDRKFR
jgi:hypothetical protein